MEKCNGTNGDKNGTRKENRNSTGQRHIRLLQDFDKVLLQQHPCEYLRLEDEHLQKLNQSTKQIWNMQRIGKEGDES